MSVDAGDYLPNSLWIMAIQVLGLRRDLEDGAGDGGLRGAYALIRFSMFRGYGRPG